MSIDSWASSYEAPTSLDAGRVLGARPMRPTLWTFAAVIGALPLAGTYLFLALTIFISMPIQAQRALAAATMPIPVGSPIRDQWYTHPIIASPDMTTANVLSPLGMWLLGPTIVWILICMIMSGDWGGRPAEHWIKAWIRHRVLPKNFENKASLFKHHVELVVRDSTIVDTDGTPRAVVEVSTINLRMTDEDTMASNIKKLHAFYVSLRWPVQIVIRSWTDDNGSINRRWFVAVMAPTPELLANRLTDIVAGLKRAGLSGRVLNGDMFDTLQKCWHAQHVQDYLGPAKIQRKRNYVVVDGEFVRGFVLAKIPRTVDPNWLAPLIDGDLQVDMSFWLDPIDNVDELDNLAGKINSWETAQLLSTNSGGYRDPDIQDQIEDAKRTRTMLRKPGQLRVFFATIGIIARGRTLEEMSDRERQIIDLLREQVGPDPLLPIDWEHDRAPLLGVPTGSPPVSYPLRMVTPMLARSYPFSSSSLTMAGGVACGTSKGSARENFLNLWNLTNPHMFIPATTGAGKGYWVKVFLWRMMAMFPNRRVWIIQAEKDEYSALAEAIPTTDMAESNVDAIYSTEHPEAFKLTNQRTFGAGIIPGGQVIRIKTLDEIEEKLYRYKPFHYLVGPQLTVYDLTRMDQKEKGIAIAQILRIIEQSVEREGNETLSHVVVDELGIVLRSKEAAAAIDTGYRRFRSIPHIDNPKKVSRIGMIGISQRPSDVLHHETGKVIADLAETHLYLRQKPTELRSGTNGGTAKILNLNKDEQEYLELAEDGDALLVAGRFRVGLHLNANPEEHNLAKT